MSNPFFYFRNNNIRWFVDIWTGKLQMSLFFISENLVSFSDFTKGYLLHYTFAFANL